jgi:hypothetical protein
MPRGSADPPKSAGEVNVYWRRRVIALAAGISLLGLVTWTVNGVLGGGTMQASNLSQTSRQHGSHHSAQPAPGTTSSPTPASTADHPSATPSATGKPGPSPSSSARRGASGTRRGSGQRGRKAHGPGACPHAALVLSLFSARYSYPAHARPQFTVDVVSTAPGRCTADLGPAHVHVVIRAGGKKPVWDSADCARTAAQATVLARGVPAAIQLSWNRQISAGGCRSRHRAARPGTYTATAYSGNLSSHAMIFVLKGHGIARP